MLFRSKQDRLDETDSAITRKLATEFTNNAGLAAPIPVSAKTGEGIDLLRSAIRDSAPEEFMQKTILGGLLEDGSLVLLVMPQDIPLVTSRASSPLSTSRTAISSSLSRRPRAIRPVVLILRYKLISLFIYL